MSQEDLDRLVAERSLVRKEFEDADVAGFWAKAVASYQDARRGGISADSRFLLAYTACLQATFAVLAASGLRVKAPRAITRRSMRCRSSTIRCCVPSRSGSTNSA